MIENKGEIEGLNVEDYLTNILALEIQEALDNAVLNKSDCVARGKKVSKSSDITPFVGTEEEKAIIKKTFDNAKAWKAKNGSKYIP